MAKTLTLAIMDAPYETTNSTTAFRIINSALNKGHNVNVFAYEGAVNLSMAEQTAHPNPVKGTSLEEEDHPLTKDWVSELFSLAQSRGLKLDWVNCGMCVDERGAGNWVDGPRRGGPPDFLEQVSGSDNVLVIPTKRNS
jgi:tRNA 2-thiouridine synthesizing protein D